ncbi:major facilitator superfamily MFS_1, partial [Reticulomyxa filosa]
MMALSYGGEFTIALTYLSNITASPSKVAYRRGVLISALLVFMMGRLLATLAYYASDSASSEGWVWRTAFLVSIVFTVPGLVLRMSLPEDKIYAQVRVRGEVLDKPFVYVIRNYQRELAVLVGSFSACIVTWKVAVEWYPKFIYGSGGINNSGNSDKNEGVYADNVNVGVGMFLAFGFLVQGFLSDEHGMFAVLIRSFVLGFSIFTVLPILIGFIHVRWILAMLQ